MKKRINIAELLKDCPTGMELDSTMFEKVTFVRVQMDRQFPIEIAINGICSKYLTKEGCFHDITLLPEAKCVIFPKGKTTWEGFQRPFRDGDVLFVDASDGEEDKSYQYVFILDFTNKHSRWQSYCYVCNDGSFSPYHTWLVEKEYQLRFATEEEKERLFKAIKDNGYKWNPETKELEKLIQPKFKVGDVIVNNYRKHLNGDNRSYKIYQITNDKYIFTDGSFMYIQDQNNWVLNTSKFDITMLKPFDKVLARCSTFERWRIQLFEKYDKTCKYPFICMGYNKYKQCIPYEGNENLLDTADNCVDYFKTWE